jgi:hypothetical protein
MWFDDLASLQAATSSEAWNAMQSDARTLFACPVGLVIARERVQKGAAAGVNS